MGFFNFKREIKWGKDVMKVTDSVSNIWDSIVNEMSDKMENEQTSEVLRHFNMVDGTVTNPVRRLTPLEAERCQGLPDGWSDIGDYIDTKGKPQKTTDSKRYELLGNGIALPFWAWLLKRINEHCEEHTMGSLFNGGGSFPLIWEHLNGESSCRWVSEIAEFPIAVTKKHFGDEETGKRGDLYDGTSDAP